MSGEEFVLNRATLQLTNVTVQTVLDCLPEATMVLVDIDEIPTQGGLIIHKPITIQSRTDSVRLKCSEEGVEVRCVWFFLSPRRILFNRSVDPSCWIYPSSQYVLLHTVAPLVIHLNMFESNTFFAFNIQSCYMYSKSVILFAVWCISGGSWVHTQTELWTIDEEKT